MKKDNRRAFLTKAIALGTASLPLMAMSNEEEFNRDALLPSLKGKKILFIFGGWAGHEPEKFVNYLTPWMKDDGAEVHSFNTLDPYADKGLMDSIDLVIQIFTQGQITKDQERGLLDAIEKNGTGMAGWHGGMCDAFHESQDYQFMTGGQWVAHPGGEIQYEVKIVDRRDEVTRGLRDFTMQSEQYYMLVDPNVKVLATTRFNGSIHTWIDGCVMPVTWKKMHGKGRIFFTSVGHHLHHVTEVPEAIEMIKRGIRWASASKYAPAEKWLSPVYSR